MSVQSEITRLENAKSDISAAITRKGVTVPSGTMLDGMAALIDSISGGGGGTNFNIYNTTTVTFNINYAGENGIGYLDKNNGAVFSGILDKGTYTFEIPTGSGVFVTGHGSGTVNYVSTSGSDENAIVCLSSQKTDVDFVRTLFNIPTSISINDYEMAMIIGKVVFTN